MENEKSKADLPPDDAKRVRLDFPKNATAKEIADAINAARRAAGYGATFNEKKR